MLEHKLEKASQGHLPKLENKGGREIAIIARRTVSLSDSSWIREICRIPNETILLEKNATSPPKPRSVSGWLRKAPLKDPAKSLSR
jgi:hypothetical protein